MKIPKLCFLSLFLLFSESRAATEEEVEQYFNKGVTWSSAAAGEKYEIGARWNADLSPTFRSVSIFIRFANAADFKPPMVITEFKPLERLEAKVDLFDENGKPVRKTRAGRGMEIPSGAKRRIGLNESRRKYRPVGIISRAGGPLGLLKPEELFDIPASGSYRMRIQPIVWQGEFPGVAEAVYLPVVELTLDFEKEAAPQ